MKHLRGICVGSGVVKMRFINQNSKYCCFIRSEHKKLIINKLIYYYLRMLIEFSMFFAVKLECGIKKKRYINNVISFTFNLRSISKGGDTELENYIAKLKNK